jgi:Tol biopolymer transport system component
MNLSPGTRLGPYEILSPLGAGGMGEVYRARDTRLGRDVAVKVLPQHLSANSEVRTRFEREAKTVSSLNHPNICTLFDVGREGDIDYLVMELVEGETLATRLQKGALPAPEVLRIGMQIADALSRAHQAGVVHRDLKPGNIMLTRGGAKLMDFGLARATGLGGAGSGSGVSMAALTQSPTIAQPLTAEGTIIGTFQYMSPEQLEGQETDARADIWALGCVLYEMATGKRAFEGKSQASLIGSIMNAEPAPISQIAPMTPPQLERLVRACITKNPDERVQTAHDVKLQLQWIAEGGSQTGIPAPVATGGRHSRAALFVAWGVALLAIVAGAAGVAWLWPHAHTPVAAYRFRTEAIPSMTDYFWPRVSPDGRYLVVQGQDSTGRNQAWLRPLDETVARPILGAEGLARAYWSPDSKEIAFVAGGKIQRVAVTGGTPTVVCETRGGSDLSWGSGGFILMDGRFTDSLLVVPARGGELKPASRIDRKNGEIGSAWPCFLPDGERFLFIGNLNSTAGLTGDIRLGRLGSLDSKLLGKSDGRVEYAPGDWLLYLKGTSLVAQKLDLDKEELTGEPLTLAENVRVGGASGHFSISTTGVLAYSRGEDLPALALVETDRIGKPVGGVITRGLFSNPAVPADGRRVLLEGRDNGGAVKRVLVRDLERGTETKLTLEGNSASMPVWSPDGRRFACVLADDGGKASVLVSSSDGLGARNKIVLHGGGAWMLTQWSPSLAGLVVTPPSFKGVFLANPDSSGAALRPVLGLDQTVGQCVISPDGKWAAYVSNEGGGPPQVYVQSITGTPGRWQISTTFGIWPVWTKGGTEIVFESQPALMAVSIDARDGFHPGTPHTLFAVSRPGSPIARYWTCTAAGDRFFLLQAPRGAASGVVEVVTRFGSLVNR